MSDQVILNNAFRRKEELLKEIAEIDAFIKVYRKLSDIFVDDVDESIDQNLGIPQREFSSMMKSILLNSGRPMTSRQLLNFLREHNVQIGGADELKNLTTKLWRARDEIERLDNGSYWPKGTPRHT